MSDLVPYQASEPQTTLWSKLSAVSRACSYVQKDGTNQFHRYNYATAANIYEKVNLALFDNGVASFVEMQMHDMREKPTTKGTDFLVTVKCLLTLVDCDTGEQATTISYGSGADSGDKAIMKAQTAALKYAWINLLNISTGDDPEADEKTDARAEGTTIKAKKAQYQPGSRGGSGPLPVDGKSTEEHLAQAKLRREAALRSVTIDSDVNINGVDVKAGTTWTVDDPGPEEPEDIFQKLEAVKEKVAAKVDAETTECPKCGAIIETFDKDGKKYRECHARHMDRYAAKDRGETEAQIRKRGEGHYFKWIGGKK